MDSKHRFNLYMNKALNDFEDGYLDDAETILLEAKNICDDDRVTSLLKKIQDAKACLVTETSAACNDVDMKDTQSVPKDIAERNYQIPATLAEREYRMTKNMLLMRVRILKMQIEITFDRIHTVKTPEFVKENTKQTEKFTGKAEMYLRTGNFGRAGGYLSKAEGFYSEVSAILFPIRVKKEPSNEYLRMKKPVKASINPGVTKGVNKEEVVSCLKKAETAFSDGDLQKAEKWLMKSLRMCPTRNAQDMLSKIRAAIAETEDVKPSHTEDSSDPNDEHQLSQETEAEKCFEAAKNALANDDFDKSYRLFSKAKRMNKSLDVDNFLKEIEAAKASRSSTDENFRKNQSHGLSESSLKEEAETYIQVAKNALKEQKFERAEQFVLQSLQCFPLKSAKELQTKIEAAKLSHKDLKEQAETYLQVAKNALKEQKFERAEHFVLQSLQCFPLKSAKELQTKIEAAKLNHKDLKEQAETCLQIAKDALKEQQFERAEQCVLQSLQCFPLKSAKELYKAIEAAKSSHNNKISKTAATAKAGCSSEESSKEILDSNNITEENVTRSNQSSKEEAETYLEIAENALRENNIDRAKEFISRSMQCCPTEHAKENKKKIDEIIRGISRPYSKSYQCPTYASAVKQKPRRVPKGEPFEEYLEKAEEFLELGNLIGAEHYALNAQRLSPRYNEKIQSLLAKIDNIRKQTKFHNRQSGTNYTYTIQNDRFERRAPTVNEGPRNKPACTSTTKYEVENLVGDGVKACETGNVSLAKQNFQKAYDLEPSECNKDLLWQIEEIEGKTSNATPSYQNKADLNYESTSKDAKSKTDVENEYLNLTRANVDRFLTIAQNSLRRGDIKNAELFLMKIENIKSCDLSRELYIEILKANHGILDGNNTQDGRVDTNVDDFKKREYVNKAENAYISGCYTEALEFIQKCDPNPYVEELTVKFQSLEENKEKLSVLNRVAIYGKNLIKRKFSK